MAIHLAARARTMSQIDAVTGTAKKNDEIVDLSGGPSKAELKAAKKAKAEEAKAARRAAKGDGDAKKKPAKGAGAKAKDGGADGGAVDGAGVVLELAGDVDAKLALTEEQRRVSKGRATTGVLASTPAARDVKFDSFSVMVGGNLLVQDCHLELSQGCRYGLIGENGSGESRNRARARARSLFLILGESANARRAAP